jgi:putative aldouronate transport system substrate-binding protein
MFIRKDWLQAVNREVPRTTAELDELVRMFAANDPDGNGRKDTWGVAFDQGAAGGAGALPGGMTLDALAAGFGAYPGSWTATEDGKLTYGTLSDKIVPVMRLLKEWYDSGAIDPEFAIKDFTKVAKDVADGKIGIVFGPFHYPIWPLRDTIANHPSADWIVAPIPTENGQPAVPKAQPFAGSWVVVRKGYPHPEALIKSLNVTYMMQSNIGDPGEFWKNAGKGEYKDFSTHLYMKPYLFDSPVRNVQTGKEIRAALETGDETKLVTSAARSIYDYINQSDDKLASWTYRKVFDEAEYVLSQYPSIQYSGFFDAPTPEMQTKGLALARLELEQLTQIVMGNSIEAFDKFRKQWLELGGEAITLEVNEWKKTH